jgi:hypothetical protein
MTEYQIEAVVERATNGLDMRLIRGTLTQAEYDSEMRALSRWAEQQMRNLPRGG